MEHVTEEMIRDAYRQGGALDGAILVTVWSDHLDGDLLFTNREGGLTSRGQDFRFVPFGWSFTGASADQPSREARLEIGRDARIVEAIRAAPKNTELRALVELVKVSRPDDVERAFTGARVPTAELEGASVVFTLLSKSFADEPGCSKRYVMARTPALFLS